MACDTAGLLDSAKCFDCLDAGQKQSIRLYLLAVIAGVSPDPAALLAQSKCMESCLSDGQLRAIEAWLLCQIANV